MQSSYCTSVGDIIDLCLKLVLGSTLQVIAFLVGMVDTRMSSHAQDLSQESLFFCFQVVLFWCLEEVLLVDLSGHYLTSFDKEYTLIILSQSVATVLCL